MKRIKPLLGIAILSIGSNFPSFAQQVQNLPEILATSSVNYKYLKSAGDNNAPEPVKILQKRAAIYNVKDEDFYADEYDNYFVSFFIPDGEILAVYDQSGKIIRTAERYKNVFLPSEVKAAVAKKYPNWSIPMDVYLVTYNTEQGADKIYKLTLQNGNERIKIKTNEKGEFLK